MQRIVPLLCLAATLPAAPTSPAPATLSREGDLVTVVLTPAAEQRLRVVTVSVARRAVPAVRLFGGEVVAALASHERETGPLLSGNLEESLRLAELQVAADGRVAQAEVQVDAAKVTLARAERIFRGEAGSERAVDEARTGLAAAEAQLRTARAQRSLLGVPAGQARRWIRVAVSSGEAALLDTRAAAQVRALTASGSGKSAARVAGPRTANAAAATVDWYYELPSELPAQPGERLAVEIPVRDSQQEHLVVPFNAVVHDISGGQWVYEVVAPHQYARRRVQVARLAGPEAVLARGPGVGAKVVTDGSAELFGTEFMTGK